MKLAFNIPTVQESPLVRVEYKVNGVKYSTVIPNPKGNEELRIVMLNKKVGMSQICTVNPHKPHVIRAN
jgi:hypothetical protein